jgi:type II secretory pathway predicted ATPase ExeA
MEQQQALPLEHWGLERWPFPTAPTADQLYATAGFTEALARIEYLVQSRRRFGALVGEPGVGKSLVMKSAARQLAKQGHAVALVDAFGITSRELLWHTATGLGAAPAEDADTTRLWRLVADRVAENRLQNINSVLLVDDAGQASPDVLTQLQRLGRLSHAPQFGGDAGALWTIVLATEQVQASRWSDSVRHLIDLRIDLRPWEYDETTGYLQTSLVEAGRLEPLFEEDAIAMLHELTQGIPRQVTRLADFTLLAGAAADWDTIDAATIVTAYEELAWPVEAVL